ncbi:cholera enterotoxin subunit A2 [Colletotrichum zoysiae]|uniref:Cholera enterotoxin subunit A2 n=1 Tax=Colletotrichum zoysiae TaxID=1216348 RepID=A0AAD9H7A2_9PEZI|nr:cholera enterotoxin subunit A2 [Colletotrichum zoysiae]
MSVQHNLFVLFYLAPLWFFLGEAAYLQAGPKFVWRGAGRAPQDVKAAGGFLPKGLTAVGEVAPNINLYSHVDIPQEFDENGNPTSLGSTPEDDGYTSFTSSFFLALGYAFYSRQQDTTWIYRVKTTPNMINVAKTLGKYNLYSEEDEYAALGGVKWDQIVSWRKVDRRNLHNFSWLWPTMNKDYDATRYGGFRTGGAQYSLAGFPPGHTAWNEEPWKHFKPCSKEDDMIRIQNPM